MSKVRAIIIEDEEKSLVVLKYMVERHVPRKVSIIATFSSSLRAKEYLENHDVDLVFLDIQMPGLDGFELLDSLAKVQFDVIFTTAFNNYATKAFRYFAIDYLLKPLIPEELIEAVKRIGKSDFRYGKHDLGKIFKSIDEQRDNYTRLAVPTMDGAEFVQMDEILRLEADGNYTFIYLHSGKRIYTSKTLKYFEELRPVSKFYRPHQSHIINVSAMLRYVKSDGGYVIMSDGAQISLARSKRQEFSERFY